MKDKERDIRELFEKVSKEGQKVIPEFIRMRTELSDRRLEIMGKLEIIEDEKDILVSEYKDIGEKIDAIDQLMDRCGEKSSDKIKR